MLRGSEGYEDVSEGRTPKNTNQDPKNVAPENPSPKKKNEKAWTRQTKDETNASPKMITKEQENAKKQNNLKTQAT